jgi:hypothetical protein
MSNQPANAPGKLTRWQKWRRRLRRVILVLVALVLLFRLALLLLLPYAINRAATFYGVDCQYSRAKMGLVGGYANLWDVAITDKDTHAPVLKIDFCEATISTWELLKGNLRVWRLGADGAEFTLDRAADGSFPMLKQFIAAQQSAKPVKKATTAPATELSFSAPLQIEALRLNRAALRIRDASVAPPFTSTVYTTVRITDIGHPTKPTQVDVDLSSEEFLDDLRITGEARSSGRTMKADLRLRVLGIHPQALRGYLKLAGLVTNAQELDASGALHLTTSGVPNTLDALKMQMSLDDLRLRADSEDACRVKKLDIAADYLSPSRITLASVEISGITANAQRTDTGALAFAGIETSTVSAAPATTPTTRPALATAPVPATQSVPVPLPPMALHNLVIRDTELRFADRAVPGSAQLALKLKEFRLTNLSSTPPQAKEEAVGLSAELSAPDVASGIHVSGKAYPFAETKTGNLSIQVEGITLKAVAPYLKALGLEPALKSAKLDLEGSGSFLPQGDGQYRGDIRMDNVSFTDTGDLLRLSSGQITGFRIDPTTLAMNIDAIDITGPRLIGQRDAGGQITLLGLRTTTASRVPATQPATVQAAQPSESLVLPIPELCLKRFTWKDIALELRDEMVQPATTFKLSDAGLEVTDLTLTARATTQPASPANLHAFFRFPGVIEKFDLTGTLAVAPTSMQFALQGELTGIAGQMLAPYLVPMHLTPVLKAGHLAGKTSGQVQFTNEGLAASMRLNGVSLTDGQLQYAGLDELRVDDLRLGNGGLSVATVQVAKPQIAVMRNNDATFTAMGMRIALPPSQWKFTTLQLPPLPLTSLGHLGVTDAVVNWTDAMFTPAVKTKLRAGTEIAGLKLGQDPATASIKASLSVEGALDSASFDGQVATARDSYRLQSTITASGLRTGPLDAYLPPTLGCTMKSGTFNARLNAAVANNADRGVNASLQINDLALRDGQTALASLKSINAAVSQVDPDHLLIAVDELSVAGIKAAIRRTSDGQMAIGGVQTLAAPPASRPKLTGKAIAPPTTAMTTQEITQTITAAHKALPEIKLGRFFVTGDEIRFIDEARPSAAPLVISDLKLSAVRPIAVLGKNAAGQPAVELELSLRAAPVIQRVLVKGQVWPFADEPAATLTLTASGIDGKGLIQLAPELAAHVDGSTLKDGWLTLALDTSAKVERHGPAMIDLERGVTADLTLSNVAFRNGDSDRILLGVKQVRVLQARLEPAAQRYLIPSIEVTQPIGYVLRDTAGVHVCGLTIPIKPATTEPASTPSSVRAQTPASASAQAPAPTTAAAAPTATVQVRKLSVSGIDFVIEDRTGDPPLVIPLNQLDAEVADFGTLSLTESRPIRFSAILNCGKAPMRPKGTREASPSLQEREVFALATANGSVALNPQPNGWVKASLSGLELVAFHGLAKDAGFNLYDGSLDADADVRILSQKDATVHAKAVITDLSITEGPNGPVARRFKFPMPLDAALPLLTDADGSISLPLSCKVTNGEVSMSSLVNSAIEAGVQAMGVAIASAPLKMVGGLLGKEKTATTKQEVTIPFKPGYAGIEPVEKAQLDQMIVTLRQHSDTQVTIRHQPGREDMTLEGSRANPTTQDVTDLISSLRLRKQALIEQRKELSVSAATDLFLHPEAAQTGSLVRLHACDQELTATESSLDKMLELLRPGAELQSGRRTRAMAIDLAEARIGAVQTYLLNSGIKKIQDRITLAPAASKIDQNAPAQGEVVVTLTSRK